MEFLRQPWHWSIAGILIGLTVPLLYLIGNKPFGISSSFRHLCAACLPTKTPFFDYDWKKETWNLFFVFGILLGRVVGATLLANPEPMKIAAATHDDLARLGVTQFAQLEPTDIFSFSGLLTARGFSGRTKIVLAWWHHGRFPWPRPWNKENAAASATSTADWPKRASQ